MEESLLGFFIDVVGVSFPFEVVADVGSKEYECVSDGDGFTFNEHRRLVDGLRLEFFDDELFCL